MKLSTKFIRVARKIQTEAAQYEDTAAVLHSILIDARRLKTPEHQSVFDESTKAKVDQLVKLVSELHGSVS